MDIQARTAVALPIALSALKEFQKEAHATALRYLHQGPQEDQDDGTSILSIQSFASRTYRKEVRDISCAPIPFYMDFVAFSMPTYPIFFHRPGFSEGSDCILSGVCWNSVSPMMAFRTSQAMLEQVSR